MLRLKHTLNGYMTLFKKKKWGLKSRISGNPFLRGTMAINKKKNLGMHRGVHVLIYHQSKPEYV